MTNVLAFPLEEAVSVLEAEGYVVETTEARSRKGVEGSDCRRVIRCDVLPGNTVRLVYSEFKTAAGTEQ